MSDTALMNDTEVLLDNNTSDELKYQVAENIINSHNLHLNTEQILLAFNKIRDWLNIDKIRDWLNIDIKCNIEQYRENCRNNRLFLLNVILNTDANMYIALILALCDNYNPINLLYFIVFKYNGNASVPFGVGLRYLHEKTSIKMYCELLDYYEFDVSDLKNIPEIHRNKIQEYRAEKYSGKLTKRAVI